MEILYQPRGGGGGSGTGFDGIVAVWSDLPVDDTADVGEVWLVRQSEGAWFFGRKQRGLWQRVDDTGDREADWQYLGEWIEEFSDANFQIYNVSDETKVGKFDASTIDTSTTRSYVMPNKDGTLALTSDVQASQDLLILYIDGEISSLSGVYQPLDSDLTTIAGLTPSANSIMQYKSGAWAARTPTQVWSDFMADPGVGAYAYTALPFTLTNNQRLLGRSAALGFTAEEIAIGSSLSMPVNGGTLDTIQDIRTSATPQFAGLLIGTATAYGSPLGFTPGNQIASTGAAGSALMGSRWSTNAAGSRFVLAKSNSSAVGTQGALVLNQEGGELVFAGSDGTSIIAGLGLVGVSEGTATTGDLRMAFVFRGYTGSTGTERGRISFAGNLLIGTATDPTGSGKIKALGIEATPIGAATPDTGAFTKISVGATAQAGEIRINTLPSSPYTQATLTLYRDGANWGYLTYGSDAQTRIVYSSTAGAHALIFGTSTAVDNTGAFTESAQVNPTGFQGPLGATTPSTVVCTTLKTSAPSGSTASTLKVGAYTSDGSGPIVTGYVIMEIGGSNRKVAIIS